ncbi:MAG: LysR substrate-binding domain-containing protein [Lentihominibacter sp.]|jgi:DNA-binding transcriptional LysR family regulator
MNINYIRYFCEVCRSGNVTKAAEKIHISQPSVSIAIRELEKQYEVSLFVRHAGNLTLTPQGEKVYEMAEMLLGDVDNFERKVMELSNEANSQLRLGIPPIMGTYILKKIIPDFTDRNPSINLKVIEALTYCGIELLEKNIVDFMIGVECGAEEAGACYFDELFCTELNLMTNINNPLTDYKKITLNQIDLNKLITLPDGSYHHNLVMSKFFKDKNLKKTAILESSQIATIKHMIKKGTGTIITYKEIFEDDDDIIAIPFDEPLTIKIGLFRSKNTYMTNSMKKMKSFLLKSF